MKVRLTLLSLVLLTARATALTPAELQRITFDQHVGQPLSRDLRFRESGGQAISLGDYFGDKPILLVLGYYHCPMLCALINDGMIASLQELRLSAGRGFQIVSVSIDSSETPELAAAKKIQYLKQYGRAGAEEGWHFLVGDKNTIVQLANEIGFRFAYDPRSGEFAHPSGFIVLTPEGKISRYLLGVRFDARELQAAITAAADRQEGSLVKQLVLVCFHYSPITGKYGALIMNVLRLSSVLTLILLLVLIVRLARNSRWTLTS